MRTIDKPLSQGRARILAASLAFGETAFTTRKSDGIKMRDIWSQDGPCFNFITARQGKQYGYLIIRTA